MRWFIVILIAVGMIVSGCSAKREVKNDISENKTTEVANTTDELYLEKTVDMKLSAIISQQSFSSNPYDFVKNNSDYADIVDLGQPALDYMLSKFEQTTDNGLKEYVMAIACTEILGENPDQKDWSSGREWYEKYLLKTGNPVQEGRNIETEDLLIDEIASPNQEYTIKMYAKLSETGEGIPYAFTAVIDGREEQIKKNLRTYETEHAVVWLDSQRVVIGGKTVYDFGTKQSRYLLPKSDYFYTFAFSPEKNYPFTREPRFGRRAFHSALSGLITRHYFLTAT